MRLSFESIARYSLVLFFLGFCSSAIILWSTEFGWHDQQRIAQLCLIVVCSALAFFLPQVVLSRTVQALLAGLFILGFASVLLAQSPVWAIREWARYQGLVLLAFSVGGLVSQSRQREMVFGVLALVGCLHAFQFLVSYAAAFISGIRVLDANLLFSGFSNPRFFGQLQVMLLPVLASLLVLCEQRQLGRSVIFLFLVMVVQWCIAFVLGGRGLWLGLLISHLLLVFFNRSFVRFLVIQLLAAVVGFLIYLLLFKIIPFWLELEAVLRDGLRAGLSGREFIWHSAWDMALANPWLGVGPMHFSATYNPIAAHPHQVILQWLAEWGFAAAGLAMLLGVRGIVKAACFLRRSEADESDAGLWSAIVGALVLAQVDGVFVMPYTETWLAVLIGLALSRWGRMPCMPATRQVLFLFFAVPVVSVLGSVLIQEVPALPACERAYSEQYGADWAPRFWQQGWIFRRCGI